MRPARNWAWQSWYRLVSGRLFDIFNRSVMYNKLDEARRKYARLSPEQHADACIECRECEEKCPQSIAISEWMTKLDKVLG